MDAPQRVIKIRRDYNTWVANETIEDYALRFNPRAFRKWSVFRVSNASFGAISFLVLEAIGGSIALGYGFTNAFWAILAVGLVIFLTGLPISMAARCRSGSSRPMLSTRACCTRWWVWITGWRCAAARGACCRRTGARRPAHPGVSDAGASMLSEWPESLTHPGSVRP